jgi:SAM-dependent methyltransferase
MDRREKMLGGLDLARLSGIEIGALAWPLVKKSDGDITYVDFTDTESLRKKYTENGGAPVKDIVEVDVIWGQQTLQEAIGGRSVDYVVASHVVEHVPDLLTWLHELRSVLKPGGEIRLAVPDRRFTFDYYRRETTIADVLNAHLIRARVPQPQPILDFLCHYVDLDKAAAWRGEYPALPVLEDQYLASGVKMANEALAGQYHDVHCWVFTPTSMATLFIRLAEGGKCFFECAGFHDTERDSYEFIVMLRPSDDKERVIRSWAHVRDSTRSTSGEIRDQQIAALKAKILLMEKSRSWRITKPLRALSAFLVQMKSR